MQPVQPDARRKSPSITDVARAAGISATTVSHAISGRRPVSHDTKRAIRRAMGELGYVPSHAGRSLRVGSSQMLGLLVPDVANPFYAELARAVEDVAESHGFNVLLCNTNLDRQREDRYAQVFRSGVIDGVICAGSAAGGACRGERLAREIPVVSVNETLDSSTLDSVCTDNRRGGALAGEHLRLAGHERVLVIDGPSGSPTSELRKAGFRRAFAGSPATIVHRRGDYRAASSAAIVAAELDQRGRWFTAVFAANDVMAVAAMRELQARAVVVPGEVAVVGFDDSLLAALVTPGLTTVRQPVYEMGRAGAERLIELIEGAPAPAPTHARLAVELIVRASSDSDPRA